MERMFELQAFKRVHIEEGACWLFKFAKMEARISVRHKNRYQTKSP